MPKQQQPFEQRVKRIARKHERMEAAGASAKLNKDGLIVMRPRRTLGPGLSILRPILAIVAAVYAFKVYLYVSLGPEGYASKMAVLSPDDPVERTGAFLMQLDPATLWIADTIRQALG